MQIKGEGHARGVDLPWKSGSHAHGVLGMCLSSYKHAHYNTHVTHLLHAYGHALGARALLLTCFACCFNREVVPPLWIGSPTCVRVHTHAKGMLDARHVPYANFLDWIASFGPSPRFNGDFTIHHSWAKRLKIFLNFLVWLLVIGPMGN